MLTEAKDNLRQLPFNVLAGASLRLIETCGDIKPVSGVMVGVHMLVITSKYDRRVPQNTGEIHLCRHLYSLEPEESLLQYTRWLRRSCLRDLQILAWHCKQNLEEFQGIDSFHGVSPLANSFAEKAGFTISKAALAERIKCILKYKLTVCKVAGRNKYWRKFLWDINNPQKATITREQLIERYGKEPLFKGPEEAFYALYKGLPS